MSRTPNATKQAKPTIAGNPNPNKDLPLEQFDYQNLNGESFKEYEALIRSGKLNFNDKYDFEMWLATAQRKFRINEDTGEREEYTAGIVLNGNKAIQITRIKLKDALELNKYVSHNSSERTTSKYYLLAKPKSE